MRLISVRIAPVILIAALVLGALALSGPGRSADAAQGGMVSDQYIVQFEPGVDPNAKANEKAKKYGLSVSHVYSAAFDGFAAFVPPGQLKKLQADPDVLSIAPDFRVTAF